VYLDFVLWFFRMFALFSYSLLSVSFYHLIVALVFIPTKATAPSDHFAPPAQSLLIEAEGQYPWLGHWTLEHSTSSIGSIVEEPLKHQHLPMQLSQSSAREDRYCDFCLRYEFRTPSRTR
jgi:hypothetical protein